LQIELVQRPLDAHEEQAQVLVLVLVRVQDVGAVRVEKIGDGRDQPLAVGTIDQQRGCVSVFFDRPTLDSV